MRAVKVIRQSSTTDDAASPHMQDKSLDHHIAAKGWTCVGSAVDLDTSASIPPEDRPELGPWFVAPREFDALVVWRLDRIARNTLDFARLLEWANEHGKTIVSVTEGFDLSTPVGKMVAQILMVFAEFELASIIQRASETRKSMRASGRWPGGRPPYGYRPIKRKDGPGWALDIDPEATEIIREIAERMISGESAGQIGADLNARGVTSPDVHTARRSTVPDASGDGSGNPRGGKRTWSGKWVARRVNRMMQSYGLRGYMMETIYKEYTDATGRRRKRAVGRQPVIGDDGQPVIIGPEILDAPTFRAVRASIRVRTVNFATSEPRTREARLLHHVALCGICRRPLYLTVWTRPSGTVVRRYRCSSTELFHNGAPTVSADQEELETYVADWFLRRFGRMEWTTNSLDPGEDHSAAIAELDERIERLETDRYVHNRFSDSAGERRYHRIMSQLESERDRLAALPHKPAGYVERRSGRTVRDEWNHREAPGRSALLQAYYVTATVHGAPRGTPLSERVMLSVTPPDSLLELGHDDPTLGEDF